MARRRRKKNRNPILFAFSFVVGFGAVVTPGLVSTAIVSESARRGFIVGPLVATGHVLLEFVMVILATYLTFPQVRVLGLAGLLTFYFGHISGDYLWDCILSGVVGTGRKWITDGVYKWIIVACGGYLVYLGEVFITTPFLNR